MLVIAFIIFQQNYIKIFIRHWENEKTKGIYY